VEEGPYLICGVAKRMLGFAFAKLIDGCDKILN